MLYRDILYNLLGYAFGITGLKATEIVGFYRRLIDDNQAYIKWHETKRHFEKLLEEQGELDNLEDVVAFENFN